IESAASPPLAGAVAALRSKQAVVERQLAVTWTKAEPTQLKERRRSGIEARVVKAYQVQRTAGRQRDGRRQQAMELWEDKGDLSVDETVRLVREARLVGRPFWPLFSRWGGCPGVLAALNGREHRSCVCWTSGWRNLLTEPGADKSSPAQDESHPDRNVQRTKRTEGSPGLFAVLWRLMYHAPLPGGGNRELTFVQSDRPHELLLGESGYTRMSLGSPE